jgi:UDP-N-acetylmuramate dehydrogenase
MKVQKNILLKKYTTFKIGGSAEYFVAVKTKEELIEAINFAKEKTAVPLILGGGSNILASDKGYSGIVIKIQNSEITFDKENITSGAGAQLSALVKKSSEYNLTGLEWAAGIPGTLGGAIRGNAGAFEGSIADCLVSAEAYDIKKNEIVVLNKDNCFFGYRESIFKKNKNLIIISAVLKLKEGDKEKIIKKIKENIEYRQVKHPKEPSAGSCFKNIFVEDLPSNFFEKFPETKIAVKNGILPVAFLIHSCALKGERFGSAQVSKIHPNFIVNLNGAGSDDVLQLISLVKKKIKEKYNLELKEEIEILDSIA